MSQFEKFLRDMEVEKDEWVDIYHDHLFTRTCEIIAKSLEELKLLNEAQYVLNTKEELSR